jgi:hypothetical protein
MTSSFQIRVSAHMGEHTDQFYIDDVTILIP